MMELSDEVIRLFSKQGAIIISTIDAHKRIHCSVKGLVGIEKEGKVFVIDLYTGATYRNLLKNSTVSLTVVDEERFIGFTLQGNAKIVSREEIKEHLVQEWENRIVQRVSKRVISSIQRGITTKKHFEVHLPKHPQHLIEIDVEHIIDLRPPSAHKKSS